MNRCQSSSLAPLVVVLLAGALSSSRIAVAAFSVPSSSRHSTTITHTSLNLVPGQGNQLAAAFNAAAAAMKDAADAFRDEDNDVWVTSAPSRVFPTAEEALTTTTDESRSSSKKSFVSRIFSLKGAIMGRHPAAAPALLEMPREFATTKAELDGNDVVLYPLVGFRFVPDQDKPGATKVLPSMVSNPSCRITCMQDQDVYGWFCPSCPLESIFSDNYCDAPLCAPPTAVVSVMDNIETALDKDKW